VVKKNEQIKDIISDNYLKKEIFKKWLSDVLLKKEKKVEKDHHCLILFCWAILLTIYLPVCPSRSIPQKYVRTNRKVYFVSKSLSKCYFWFVLYFGSYRYIYIQKEKVLW